jgi:hypothetical protein
MREYGGRPCGIRAGRLSRVVWDVGGALYELGGAAARLRRMRCVTGGPLYISGPYPGAPARELACNVEGRSDSAAALAPQSGG